MQKKIASKAGIFIGFWTILLEKLIYIIVDASDMYLSFIKTIYHD